MKLFFIPLAIVWLFVGVTDTLLAHGIPIDVLANSVTNRLFVIEGFEAGDLLLAPGVEISTTSPGLGVNFATNGIAANTAFQLEVSQELLFWDGTGVSSPATDLLVFNPAFTSFYRVTATSGVQTGLDWATYPGGSAWDAHGLYRLDSLAAPTGIYGLAVQVAAVGYDPTKPFLLPLIYDPSSQWNANEINDGIELLRAVIDVPFSADFNNDTDVDGLDFLTWQRGFGPVSSTTLPSDGDADFDSDVDRFDFEYWESKFGSQVVPASTNAFNVPEPSTLLLALVGLICLRSFFVPRWTLQL